MVLNKEKIYTPEANVPSIFKQIVAARSNDLELIRECLSNACAKEVGATTIQILYTFRGDGTHEFTVTDNGCGMDFSGDPDNPGRLERFIDLAKSRQAGLEADEFSDKGLGSALLYNSEEFTVETRTEDGKGVKAIINDSYRLLMECSPPQIPKVLYYEDNSSATGKGTKIKVTGYRTAKREAFTFKQLKDYIYERTVIGCTKMDRVTTLPKVILKADGKEEELVPGFRWMKLPDELSEQNRWKVFILPEPIEAEHNGIKVNLNGGAAYMVDKALNADKEWCGVIFSSRGIPYFHLDLRKLKHGKTRALELPQEFYRMVLNCDDIFNEMSPDRAGLNESARVSDFYTAAKKCLKKFTEYDAYKILCKKRRDNYSDMISRRQAKLSSPDQKFIWLRQSEGKYLKIHKKPENEHDTLAVLWKLEGLNALPFRMNSMEHASREGVDLIIDLFQDKTEPDLFACAEVKYEFKELDDLRHDQSLTRYVFCWCIPNGPPDGFKKVTEYKYVVQRPNKPDRPLTVFVLSEMAGIKIATISDIKSSNL